MRELTIKILRKQRERGLTGFTMPYLIGSLRDPVGNTSGDERQDYQEFIELLQFFQSLEHIPQCYVGISECVELKQPVVALYDSLDKINGYSLELIEAHNGSSTLYASSEYHKKGSFDDLANMLWSLSEKHILIGDFSFERGQYSKFTDADKNFITDVYSA